VGGHRLGVFKGATIVEKGRNAGGAKSVIADRRRNASRQRAALQHPPGVGLRHRAIG
jgi:hypothetical protein